MQQFLQLTCHKVSIGSAVYSVGSLDYIVRCGAVLSQGFYLLGLCCCYPVLQSALPPVCGSDPPLTEKGSADCLFVLFCYCLVSTLKKVIQLPGRQLLNSGCI